MEFDCSVLKLYSILFKTSQNKHQSFENHLLTLQANFFAYLVLVFFKANEPNVKYKF